MPSDLSDTQCGGNFTTHRAIGGSLSYHKGLAAEEQVARHYETRGAELRHVRWRGSAGELDLVLMDGNDTVLVEVKSSRNLADAAQLLSSKQIERIFVTAEEYLAQNPTLAGGTVRMDVALVDRSGQIEILENAVMQS